MNNQTTTLVSILKALVCGKATADVNTDLENVYDDHNGISVSHEKYWDAIADLNKVIAKEHKIDKCCDTSAMQVKFEFRGDNTQWACGQCGSWADKDGMVCDGDGNLSK